MKSREIRGSGNFDKLFLRNVPHIMEKIFFSSDYMSFKTCMRVNKTWRYLLITARYQKELPRLLNEKYENEVKLHIASRHGNAEEVKRLICKHMVNVNIKMGWEGSTPLREAAFGGHNEVICILFEARADTEQRNRDGYTPLIAAISNHHIEAVKILLGAGALVDNADMGRKSPRGLEPSSLHSCC